MIPKVSILIPAYNAQKWIKNSIKSAINQTYQNKEIIVVDDGSIDNTFLFAKQFESNTVKIIKTKNNGACAARNYAFSLSMGDYIQWLDADDILAPDKIEKQMDYVKMNPDPKILISGTFLKFYSRLKSAEYFNNYLYEDFYPIDWLITHFEKEAIMYPHAWLVSRQLAVLAGPWNENLRINQDGEYFARVVSKASFVKYIKEAKCYYRRGNTKSISNTRTMLTIKYLSLANNLCVDTLISLENSIRTRKAAFIFLQRFVSRILFIDDLSIVVENNNRIESLGGSKVVRSYTSLKFKFFSKLFGRSLARKSKSILWDLEIKLKSFWDFIFSIFFNDRV